MVDKNALVALSAKVTQFKSHLKSEEATKTAFILPFLRALGYDDGNPIEFIPEYTCDVGKEGEKVDYAIVIDDSPKLLIECKSCEFQLSKKHITQLFRYYSVCDAHFAILTNGVEYQFFTDRNKANVMDDAPFFVFNAEHFEDSQLETLDGISREHILDTVMTDLVYSPSFTEDLTKFIIKEFNNPSDTFVNFLVSNLNTYGMSDEAIRLAIRQCLGKRLNVVAITDDNTEEEDDCDEAEPTPVRVEAAPAESDRKKPEGITGYLSLAELDAKAATGSKVFNITVEDELYDIPSASKMINSFIDHVLSSQGLNAIDFVNKCTSNDINAYKTSEFKANSLDCEQGVYFDCGTNLAKKIQELRSLCEVFKISPEKVKIGFISKADWAEFKSGDLDDVSEFILKKFEG